MVLSLGAQAQIAPTAAPHQFAQMGNLQLEGKAVIRNCAIGYRTLAALEFAQLLKADTTVLEGNCGHWAVSCEMAKVRPVVEAALQATGR